MMYCLHIKLISKIKILRYVRFILYLIYLFYFKVKTLLDRIILIIILLFSAELVT